MTRFEIVLGLLITAATACLLMAVIIAASSQARADDLPRGLGHPPGKDHWYDNACCSKRDCEPVEPGAIRHLPDGYMVKYRTSRGHVAEGFIPKNATGVRVSKDAQEHACAPSDKVVCIYLPMTM